MFYHKRFRKSTKSALFPKNFRIRPELICFAEILYIFPRPWYNERDFIERMALHMEEAHRGKTEIGKRAHRTGVIAAVGVLTGCFAGLIATLYNSVAEMVEEFAAGYYGYIRDNPWFVPLLFLGLFLGGIVIGGSVRLFPVLKGSGFPQTEGVVEGKLHFRWYQALIDMFAAGLFCVFAGASAGAEGPSLLLGGACGGGVGRIFRCGDDLRRYSITGGACAGLAVSLNAPLTGMIFAFEEAHKRFTPEVFVCSFSSVVAAMAVRALLGPCVGLHGGPFLKTFSPVGDAGLLFTLEALGAAAVCALLAVALYYAILFAHRRFQKLTFFRGTGRYLIPFLAMGVLGLFSVWAMGSGIGVIESLGSGSEHTMSVFGAPIWATLLIVIALRFVASVLNAGCDLPCCSSVPMMAIGACVGSLMSLLFEQWGMDPMLADGLVIVCMVTFLSAVVKAPLTGIIMSVELTQSFSFLLPAIVGVAVGYLVGEMFRTEPLYEVLLEDTFGRPEEPKAPKDPEEPEKA